MNLNKFFIIEFKPKQIEHMKKGRSKYAIGGGQLEKYIGKSNTKAVIKMAENSTAHVIKIKFRKMGTITLYYR